MKKEDQKALERLLREDYKMEPSFAHAALLVIIAGRAQFGTGSIRLPISRRKILHEKIDLEFDGTVHYTRKFLIGASIFPSDSGSGENMYYIVFHYEIEKKTYDHDLSPGALRDFYEQGKDISSLRKLWKKYRQYIDAEPHLVEGETSESKRPWIVKADDIDPYL